jgi:hypothetical protein
MNFSSIRPRSAAVALVVSGIAFFGISGMAYAQGTIRPGRVAIKRRTRPTISTERTTSKNQ